jgi:hypothetical protein
MCLEFDANKIPSENFKKIIVVLDVIEKFVAQNLPKDANKYVLLDILSVHRDYIRSCSLVRLVNK